MRERGSAASTFVSTVAALFAYFLLFVAFWLSKPLAREANPLFSVPVRFLFAGLVAVAVSLGRRKREKNDLEPVFPVDGVALRELLKAAILGEALCFVAEFFALQKLTVSTVTLAFAATPAVAAVLEAVFESRGFSLTEIFGLVMSITGAAGLPELIFSGKLAQFGNDIVSHPWHVFLLWVSVIAGAYVWFPLSRFVKRTGYSNRMANGMMLLVSGMAIFFLSIVVLFLKTGSISWSAAVQTFSIGDLWKIFWLILALTVLSSWGFNELYMRLLPTVGYTKLSLLGVSTVLYSKFAELIFGSRSLTQTEFLSIIFLLIGLLIFFRANREVEPR